MSITKITITKEDLLLVKALAPYTESHETSETPRFKEPSPFGITDIMREDAYMIIFGKYPETFDISDGEVYQPTDDENRVLDEHLNKIHYTLDIVLYFAGEKVETGTYKTKFPLRDWKKIK